MPRDVEQVHIQFRDLLVNAIDTNSGIFFGNKNIANGWSSHSKSNNGFGDASNSTIRSINLIMDNDLIDSPIDDRDVFITNHQHNAETVTSVDLHDMQINALDTNSTVSMGEIEQTGWSSHAKANSGGGRHKGVNISRDFTIIHDEDYIDVPIQDNGIINVNTVKR